MNIIGQGTGKMAQWLNTLTALPEDPGSITSIHMTTYYCLQMYVVYRHM